MSILKNLFAAVGAVTLGAVAVGVVLGATTAMTADDDDFDLDELRDDAPCGGCRKCAEKNAEKDAEENVRGIMYVQIQPGKSDQRSQDQGGNADFPVVSVDCRGRSKGSVGMARRKGKIRWRRDEKFYCRVDGKGAQPGYQRF